MNYRTVARWVGETEEVILQTNSHLVPMKRTRSEDPSTDCLWINAATPWGIGFMIGIISLRISVIEANLKRAKSLLRQRKPVAPLLH